MSANIFCSRIKFGFHHAEACQDSPAMPRSWKHLGPNLCDPRRLFKKQYPGRERGVLISESLFAQIIERGKQSTRERGVWLSPSSSSPSSLPPKIQKFVARRRKRTEEEEEAVVDGDDYRIIIYRVFDSSLKSSCSCLVVSALHHQIIIKK